MRKFLAAAMVATLIGCAGRPPQQIAVIQPQDRYADCLEITSEIQANNQRMQSLQSEQNGKIVQNVAAGVAGLVIWPLFFAMDLQGSAGADLDALGSRNHYLGALAASHGCIL